MRTIGIAVGALALAALVLVLAFTAPSTADMVRWTMTPVWSVPVPGVLMVAQARGRARTVGHVAGARTVRRIVEEARRLVESGARLVDVRTPGEFAAGHLPGAINIPVQDLERRLHELGPKQAPIVVYCRFR